MGDRKLDEHTHFQLNASASAGVPPQPLLPAQTGNEPERASLPAKVTERLIARDHARTAERARRLEENRYNFVNVSLIAAVYKHRYHKALH